MDFGITPQQLDQIIARWRRCGQRIADLDIEVGDLSPSGGAAAASLRDCGRIAREASTARAEQLDALANALAKFAALTADADDTAASALARRRS